MNNLISLNQLEELFYNFKHQAFRLETLPEYQIDGEWEQYQDYLKGIPCSDQKDLQDYCQQIKQLKNQGKQIVRVRVFDLPLSDYLKFEIDCCYKENLLAGEEIKFIKRSEIEKLSEEKLKDFWLFDEKLLVLLTYDLEGKFSEAQMLDNPEIVEKYINLKSKILSQSIIFNKFEKKFYGLKEGEVVD